MPTTEHDDPALTSRRERPRPSDIKQLFERYRRASRHVDDAERPPAAWLAPKRFAKRAAAPPAPKP
jgi:hypothetical protein